MRKLFWLSPFIFIVFFGVFPATAETDRPLATAYIAPNDVDLANLLAPPPSPGSETQKHDLQTVVNAQKRTKKETALVVADGEISIYRFADVLGANFTKDRLQKTDAFFAHVRHDTGVLVGAAKDYWKRPRPFVVDRHIHPPGKLAEGVTDQDGTVSFSYPSGHSTFGALTAILLSDMVPERCHELFARGWDFGWHRVEGGVHFPTDVEAGRIEATLFAAVMMQKSAFKEDFNAAKAELRADLGLPAQAPASCQENW